MSNLSVTTECNRQCPYCFAGKAVAVNRISRTAYNHFLDYLKRSDIDQVRLLGGEPTLHPDFSFFVEETSRRGFRVLIFSNGVIPENVLTILESVPADKLQALINVTPYNGQTRHEKDRQCEALKRLSQKAMLGFTIYTPNPDFGFLRSYIETYSLKCNIRVGLAHPCPDGSNQWLHPKHYQQVGNILADFALSNRDLTVEFDCGFVPCMFPEEFLSQADCVPEDIGRRCGPIPDMLADGSAVHCFPLLSTAEVNLTEDLTAQEVKALLSRRMEPYQGIGVFAECSVCCYRTSGKCFGGCIATARQRLRSSSHSFYLTPVKGIAIKDYSPADSKACDNKNLDNIAKHEVVKQFVIPFVDQPLPFWKNIADEYGRFVKEVYAPVPGGRIASGRPFQPNTYLTPFLESGCFKANFVINPIVLREPAEDFVKPVVKQLRFLTDHYPIAGLTLANLDLGRRIRDHFPDIQLTASVLMDIHTPYQIELLGDIFDCLVPSSRIMRDIPSLRKIRSAFKGKIRLIVNEACLPGCPYRTQHFYEMSSNIAYPRSLCDDLLKAKPWLRLTGSWVLPQHLYFYDGIYDEIKLAGRVTLKESGHYMKVLNAYITGAPLYPNEIGGGPASVLKPINIDDDFYCRTLYCEKQCHQCDICRTYHRICSIQKG
jgi:hypothetical protein